MLFIIEQLRSASDMFDFRANNERIWWTKDIHDGDGYTQERRLATVYDTEKDVLSEQDMIELKGGWAIVIPMGDIKCNTGISS